MQADVWASDLAGGGLPPKGFGNPNGSAHKSILVGAASPVLASSCHVEKRPVCLLVRHQHSQVQGAELVSTFAQHYVMCVFCTRRSRRITHMLQPASQQVCSHGVAMIMRYDMYCAICCGA